jgi:hypothetical protein
MMLFVLAFMLQTSSKYDAAPIDPTSEGLFSIMREKPFWEGRSAKSADELTLCLVSALWHHDLSANAFRSGAAVYVKTQFTLAKLSQSDAGGTAVNLWGGGGSKGGIVPRVRGCL